MADTTKCVFVWGWNGERGVRYPCPDPVGYEFVELCSDGEYVQPCCAFHAARVRKTIAKGALTALEPFVLRTADV